MAGGFDGSGNFTRKHDWTNEAAAGVKILSTNHDDEDDNFASGISRMICKDGQSTIEQDIPWSGKKITNLGGPTNPTDAATKGYADAIRNFSTQITLTGTSTGVAPTQVSRAIIGFTEVDMSIVGRNAGSPAGTVKRLAINDAVDGTGTDVLTITEAGDVLGATYFIDRPVYNSNATYTKPTIAANGRVPKYVEVWVQAGGGGGGGAAAGANNASVGSGGGSGSASYKVYDGATLPATVAIVVGAQGASGPGNGDGGNGGASSFGGVATNGGVGGYGSPNSAVAWAMIGGSGGPAGGSGDINFAGTGGQGAIKYPSPPYAGLPGGGAPAPFGGGGGRGPGSAGGAPLAGNLGGGGGGGLSYNAGGGSAGSPGGPGFVKVREWY